MVAILKHFGVVLLQIPSPSFHHYSINDSLIDHYSINDSLIDAGFLEHLGVVLLWLPSPPFDHRAQALLHLEERRISLILQPRVLT